MNKRVTVAFAFGFALLLASYTFAPKTTAPPADPTQGVVVAPAPVRQYIPTTDANDDGIPDWQENLLPAAPLEIKTGEEYQAPDTVTDQFAVTFFEAMVRNEQNGEFAETPEELAARAATALTNELDFPTYTLDDINPNSDNSLEAFTAYAVTMETIAIDATPEGEPQSELAIVSEALETNDPAVLARLAPIRAGYEEMLAGFLAVPVPSSLAGDHLILVTTVSAVLEHLKGMEQALNDPLLGLMHVQQYESTVTAMTEAINSTYTKLVAAGVTYAPESNPR